jgi:hypothetical protein
MGSCEREEGFQAIQIAPSYASIAGPSSGRSNRAIRNTHARLRIMMAIAAGSLYVTEQFSDTEPFVSGEHFAMAPPENIPSTIIHFLCNEAERLKIARNAARFAEERLDLGQLLLRACC